MSNGSENGVGEVISGQSRARRVLLVWDAPNMDMGLGAIIGGRPTAAHRPRFDAVGRWLLGQTESIRTGDDPSRLPVGVLPAIEAEATVFTNVSPGSADVVRPWVDALRNVGYAVFAKPKITDDTDVDDDMLAHIEMRHHTTGLAGQHQIEIILDPGDTIHDGDVDPANNRVTLNTTVEVASGQAALDAAATWQTTEIACCFVHVVSDTAAARDLPTLLPLLESAVVQSANRMAIRPSQKLNVYLIDRIVGQGGFAGTDMVVSYVDRRYAGGSVYELLVHEATHILDQQFAPRRITFLAEGLAVWASGGHYKAEDLNQRAAALLATGSYVPLAQLIDDFYPVQHEIGYLEAGGFVTYLVDRGGWSRFKEFYSDVASDDGATLSAAVDANLQAYYGMTLAQLESEWLAALQSRPADPLVVDDLKTTVRYYDVVRRYQAAYDPTAHFLSAWLPHPNQVRELGNPADLTRRPEEEINVTLEVMLVAADTAARAGDYSRANVILDSVENILENDGAIIDPMATSYQRIVRAAAEYGYELHAVTLDGNTAQATATQAPDIRLKNLVMEMRGQEWVILSH